MNNSLTESGRLIMDDCRRLTGPSLIWDKSGAILDCTIEGFDSERVLECWYRHLQGLLDTVGWTGFDASHRVYENGLSLVLEAPLDQLYSATSLLEINWYYCSSELLGLDVEDDAILIRNLRDEMAAEHHPGLLELECQAAAHGVAFLHDDDIVAVGQGQGSMSWPVDQIPPAAQIPWQTIHDIPLALITGTNGKSTSVRILDGIARAADQVSGITSTDFVRVGDDVLDKGDYSGPGGARLLLRDRRLQAAFLEVARGGILRRGLPLRRAQAALITNVGRDHLGQYGVNTLEALIKAKFVVKKALSYDGVLVVNADDDGIVSYLKNADGGQFCWFSLDQDNALIRRQIADRKPCCFTENAHVVYFDGVHQQVVCAIEEIPMTLGGTAVHNVRNALGALGVAAAMGYTMAHIRTGLQNFNSDEADNPGRLNMFQLQNGARAIVDYAHNAHSVEAVAKTVQRLPARQKWVVFGAAGDRCDADLRAIAEGICSTQPDQVVIVEVDQYLRGRLPGEVSDVLEQACLDAGLDKNQIRRVSSPLAGVKLTASQMQSDDLGLFLVLSERDDVIGYLKKH